MLKTQREKRLATMSIQFDIILIEYAYRPFLSSRVDSYLNQISSTSKPIRLTLISTA